MYGIFDFDPSSRNAGKDAIIALLESYGSIYNKKVSYALETRRVELMQNIKLNT